ncbi:hypothetical protein J437_LFUL016947 [Ladona fulva]|uniref:C-type lectin domain-containing protein n=1 Tax=Ladona fulva TaxID=123851 RepID=A0A8K0KMY8_LADFU|nr:hypothetical protein J437_LFUL016947 [Ladona fulva]
MPENAKLDVKTYVSESEGRKTMIFQGKYTAPPPAPHGHEYFPGVGYYKFYPESTAKFDKAMDTCRNDGAHLAILNSEAEMKVLKSIFARHPKTGYERWDGGEPYNYNGNDHCGAMTKSGLLNDHSCETIFNMPFLCEYDPFLGKNEVNEIQ